jgi:hypothetical protein
LLHPQIGVFAKTNYIANRSKVRRPNSKYDNAPIGSQSFIEACRKDRWAWYFDSSEIRGRALNARCRLAGEPHQYLTAKLGRARLHQGIGKRRVDRLVEPADNFRRHAVEATTDLMPYGFASIRVTMARARSIVA